MKLYFYTIGDDEEKLVANVDNVSDINNVINDFCEKHNFESYYTRTWEHEGKIVIDFGSHINFFIVKPCTWQQWLDMCEDKKSKESYDC